MSEIVQAEIERIIEGLGDVSVSPIRIRHALEQIAQIAYKSGKADALTGLLSTDDVARELGVSRRRANAIIENRHERFGVGMRLSSGWVIHRDELPVLQPDAKHRRK